MTQGCEFLIAEQITRYFVSNSISILSEIVVVEWLNKHNSAIIHDKSSYSGKNKKKSRRRSGGNTNFNYFIFSFGSFLHFYFGWLWIEKKNRIRLGVWLTIFVAWRQIKRFWKSLKKATSLIRWANVAISINIIRQVENDICSSITQSSGDWPEISLFYLTRDNGKFLISCMVSVWKMRAKPLESR